MYEKPRFHGRKCVLAEGDVEIDNPWAAYGQSGQPHRPFRIGSFKRVVRVSKGIPKELCAHPTSPSTQQLGGADPVTLLCSVPGLPDP